MQTIHSIFCSLLVFDHSRNICKFHCIWCSLNIRKLTNMKNRPQGQGFLLLWGRSERIGLHCRALTLQIYKMGRTQKIRSVFISKLLLKLFGRWSWLRHFDPFLLYFDCLVTQMWVTLKHNSIYRCTFNISYATVFCKKYA